VRFERTARSHIDDAQVEPRRVDRAGKELHVAYLMTSTGRDDDGTVFHSNDLATA
jgi:hypothetical protein